MSEYFEPVSVLSLGSVLGLGELDGDTLRRWFHGLALGAINFEDDPARWAVSDATGADIDRELAPVLERLWEAPDASMIATMLQHAEGSFDERVAAVLPTLKVILLGGMQEPGHAAGSTVAGLLESGQAAAVAADPGGLVRDAIEEGLRWVSPIGTQTRRALVETELGGVDAPGRAQISERSSPRPIGTRRSGGRPPTRTTSSARDAITPRSGSALTSARAITSRGSRCGSRCSGSSSGFRTSGPIPTGRPCSAAGSSGPRSTSTCAGTPDGAASSVTTAGRVVADISTLHA